ncbi:MAG: phytoene/squalene synthase family protein [Bryobacterales bacterium]|nr:phytoene/squalene synthase family protein [Bryobacterales bacterium]
MRSTTALGAESSSSIAALDACYAQAANATAEGSKSFYFATRFFPAHLAKAAHAVYWFCRHTDDLVDEAPSAAIGEGQLDAWEAMLLRAWDNGTADDPILRVFVETARRYAIPLEYPMELIEGMRMDLRGTQYQNFEELRVFCYRVASVVGLMMCHVIGFREPAPAHAIDLGIALQLTNILRDVGEDLGRGRIYLPHEEMAQFGYTANDLRAGIRDERFRSLMKFQIARAEGFYQQARPGIPLLSADGRFAVIVAADVYRGILKEIVDNDFDVFHRRAVVPASRKYWITARSMALPMARHTLNRFAFWKSMNA